MQILMILLLIFILGIIILVHELGHFFWAKKFKVHIYEFSIGMGPVIYSKLGKDKIKYNLRAIPLGGFVSMAGEVFEDDEENNIPKDAYMCNKKWYQKIVILVAGVVNNFILAIIILFIISLAGAGNTLTTKIAAVVEDTPAAASEIMPGDEIIKINGKDVSTWDIAIIMLHMEDEDGIYDFTVKREDDSIKTISIEPKMITTDNGTETKQFGIGIETEKAEGFFESIKYAFVKFGSIVESMYFTLYGLFSGQLSINMLSGPIGMYEVVEASASSSFLDTIYLVAFLSINVGILNILPFPAFDGGRILFLLIEKIKGSPVSSKVENIFHLVGFVLLILLSIYIAIQDIIRLI